MMIKSKGVIAMSILISTSKSKTALDKIVDKLVSTEGKVTIITGEYYPVGILIPLFERVSGVEIYSLKTVKERTSVVEKYKNEIEACGRLGSDSKFTCFNIQGHKPVDLIKELQIYLAEGKVIEIITQPDNTLFRHCSNLELEEWHRYKMYLKGIGVKMVEVEDDIQLKIAKSRGVKK